MGPTRRLWKPAVPAPRRYSPSETNAVSAGDADQASDCVEGAQCRPFIAKDQLKHRCTAERQFSIDDCNLILIKRVLFFYICDHDLAPHINSLPPRSGGAGRRHCSGSSMKPYVSGLYAGGNPQPGVGMVRPSWRGFPDATTKHPSVLVTLATRGRPGRSRGITRERAPSTARREGRFLMRCAYRIAARVAHHAERRRALRSAVPRNPCL